MPGIVFSILLCLPLLFFFLISPATPRQNLRIWRNQMFAHRGLHGNGIPENSISAFRAAKEHGYGVELDVQLSADGEVMVFHDTTLSRLCEKEEPLHALTAAQLGALRLTGTDERIPTLREALDALGGVPVICELKVGRNQREIEQLCRRTASILRTYQAPFCVESFSPFAVRWFYRHAPDIIRGQLAEKAKRFSVHRILAGNLCFNFLGRPDFIAYRLHPPYPLGFHVMRLLEVPLIAWTVYNEEDLRTAERVFDSFIFEQETQSSSVKP